MDELKADICNAAEIPCSSMDSDKISFIVRRAVKKIRPVKSLFIKYRDFGQEKYGK